jgi:geranylgeranyl diphosphate synthase type I
MSVQAYQDRYLPLVEAEMRAALAADGVVGPFYDMMRYHMGWLDADLQPVQSPAGKRLRPLLCLLVCEAVGGEAEHALPAAAALELIHNFSLIHDDIEDNSETRRHRMTVWKLWGLPHGINCGDAMFSAALLQLAHLSERGVPPERALLAQRLTLETCLKLTEGQYLDMEFERQMDVDLDGYLRMIGGKTAALVACATGLGALLGGASELAVEAYARFGENLGLAFQVIDDILGIWGREDETGKSARSDILTRKKTLPIVYVLHDPALQALYERQLSEADIEPVLAILERHQAQAYAVQQAEVYSSRALEALEQTGQTSAAHNSLYGFAESLLRRST